MDLRIAQELGYDGLEMSAGKMRAFLDAGWSEADLTDRLRPFDIPGIGFLLDLERHGADTPALIRNAAEIFHLAELAGAAAVQVLTGPVSVDTVRRHAAGLPISGYRGVLGLDRAEQMAISARNLARLADMAAERGLLVYLEALAWCPLNSLSDHVEMIMRADRPNIRLIVDFWHCYVSGDTPDRVTAHPDSFVDRVIAMGIRFLQPAFYSPPHLRTPMWVTAHEGAICEIGATIHASKGSYQIKVIADGEPLIKDRWVRFTANTFNLMYDKTAYHVQWRVTNTGLATRLKG